MAIRLPRPGEDAGDWGELLNEFLTVEHNPDGTLNPSGTIAIKYEKPDGGIPAGDLSPSVQASLFKADESQTAADVEQLIYDTFHDPISGAPLSAEQVTWVDDQLSPLYRAPDGGIPYTDLDDQVRVLLDKADVSQSASDVVDVVAVKYTRPEDGIPASDLEDAVQTSLAKADAAPTVTDVASAVAPKYQKPTGGIPLTDLTAGVQSSLSKADVSQSSSQVVSLIGTTLYDPATTAPLTAAQVAWVRSQVPVTSPANIRVPKIGHYYSVFNTSPFTQTNMFVFAGTMIGSPLWLPPGMAFDQIATRIYSTSAAPFSMVAYETDSYLYPTTLIGQTATLVGDATGEKKSALTVAATTGGRWVWLGVIAHPGSGAYVFLFGNSAVSIGVPTYPTASFTTNVLHQALSVNVTSATAPSAPSSITPVQQFPWMWLIRSA